MNTAPAFRDPLIFGAKTQNWTVFAEAEARINNCEIHGTVFIGFASYINSGIIRSYVQIGRYCSIGRDVALGLGHHNLAGLSTSPFFESASPPSTLPLASENPKRRVIIGHDCWIGDGAKIVSGIKIGDGAIVAAGAVVTRDVLPYEIVGGVPAKHIKFRFEPEICSELIEVAWWEIRPEILKAVVESSIPKSIATIRSMGDSLERTPTSYARLTPSSGVPKERGPASDGDFGVV
jgi:virginiamycin A acetyltransferase